MNKISSPAFSSWLGGSFFFLLAAVTTVSLAQGALLRGDVTGDGVIDGRDALMIMRGVEGFETLTDEESARSDVHPLPGTGGRSIGDGTVTEDDARKILRKAVGLIPEGELTGDFSNSTPVIDDIEPRTGPAGAQVTITGWNFASGSSADNQVRFGEIPSIIHEISGTTIVTEVPAGASTGKIILRTPGGTAVSSFDFVVGVIVEGVLDLGEGLNAKDFAVVNAMEEAEVDGGTGRFSISVPDNQLSVMGAVPKGDGNNVFLSIQLPGMTTGKWGKAVGTAVNPLTVDALSTAKSLLFMHPFFFNENAAAASGFMALLETLPEVHALAAVVAERYPQGAAGIEDPQVRDAWTVAVSAILAALPETLAPPMDGGTTANSKSPQPFPASLFSNPLTVLGEGLSAGGPGTSSKRGFLQSDKSVRVANIDRNFLDAKYDEDGDGILVDLDENTYCPLDWLVVLFRVDPDAFERGYNTAYPEIASTGYPHLGYEAAGFVAAKHWTAKIDILREGIGWLLDSVRPSEQLDLEYDPNDESVYLLRAFSGCFTGPEKGDATAIATMEDGRHYAEQAAALNIALAMIDLWCLVGGSESTLQRNTIKAAVQNAIFTIAQETAGKDLSKMTVPEMVRVLFRVMIDVSKAIAQGYLDRGASALQEKLQGTFKAVVEAGSATLTVLSKLSSLGRAAERVVGLTGHVINPLGWELSPGPSPLETFRVIVGDPFNPRITSFSPDKGGDGDVVTVEGLRFAEQAEDNEFYFGTVKAEQVTVVEKNKLQVVVPKGLRSNELVELYIETPGSSSTWKENSYSKEEFRYLPFPQISSIDPERGYAPTPAGSENPLAGFQGSTVKITGYHLELEADDSYVYIGDVRAPIVQKSQNELTIRVPQLEPGETELYFKNPEERDYTNPNQWLETERIPFTVLGPPTLTSVSPSQPQGGQMVVVQGTNFQGSLLHIEGVGPPITSEDATGFLFRMPSGSPDAGTEQVLLVVWNPAGSASQTLTRDPGINVESLTELEDGSTIRVTAAGSGTSRDGKISLDEAAAFVRGAMPSLLTWDDVDEEVHENYKQRRRVTGIDDDGEPIYDYYWEHTSTTTEKLDPGENPRARETRYIYRVNTYFDGEVSEPSLSRTEDMDATEDDLEEADYISGSFFGGEVNRFTFKPATRRDVIETSGDAASFSASSLHLGPQDTLKMNGATLNLSGFTDADGSEYNFGNVNSSAPLTLTHSWVEINGGDFNNGIVIDGGFENTVGNGVQINTSGSNGVLVKGGGRNSIRATITESGGNGIKLENTQENKLGGTISNCAQNGVLVSGGEKNGLGNFSSLTIENCSGEGVRLENTTGTYSELINIDACSTGLYIVGGGANDLSSVKVKNCPQNGVWLHNTRFNVVSGIFCDGSATGVLLDGACTGNTIQNAELTRNTNGLVLDGAGVSENQIKQVNAGLMYDYNAEYGPGGWTILGSTQHGIHLRAGARDNYLFQCQVYASGSHGVLIEGVGTDDNELAGLDIGFYHESGSSYGNESEAYGNAGDGLRIQGGAKRNHVRSSYIGFSKGNALTVTGSNTKNSKIEKCEIGSDRNSADGTPLSPNEGWGILVEEGASGTDIQGCILGVNKLGGIRIADVTVPHPFGLPLATLSDISIGYDRNAEHVFSERFEDAAGVGLLIENCQDVTLHDIDVTDHQTGVHISGSGCRNITGNEFEILNSGGHGFIVDGAEDCSFGRLVVSHGEGDAIRIVNAKKIEIPGVGGEGTAQESNGNGISIVSCEDVTVETMQFGPNLTGSGLFVQNSKRTILTECRAIMNGSDGFHIFDSELTDIDRGESTDNGGHGYLFERSNGVDLYGTGHTDGLFVYGNMGNDVKIVDSQNVRVGVEGKGGYFGVDDLAGVSIDGALTNTVSVRWCGISGGFEGVPAVEVLGGSGIVIGDTEGDGGNNLTFNQGMGVLAKGSATRVTVAGNQIGEYPGEESAEHNNGGQYGIVLAGGVQKARILKNRINSNKSHGILIHEGASWNLVRRNTITRNGGDGVHVDGADAVGNRLTENSITRNEGIGIGGTGAIVRPVITHADPWGGTIGGTVEAVAGSIVEAYADEGAQGRQFIGATRVLNDSFYIRGTVPLGLELHALVIDPDGNTSGFGEAQLADAGSQNNVVAYDSEVDGNTEIFLLDPKQQIPTRLTEDTASDTDPQISAGGGNLLFVSDRTGNADLWMMNADGSKPMAISSDPADDYEPDWSLTGPQCVFVSDRDGNPELYSTTVDPGAGRGEITYFTGEPTWGVSANAGDGYGVHFSAVPGTLDTIAFYLYGNNMADFTWQILGWDLDKPSDDILAEGTGQPTEQGWYTIDVGGVSTPSEFVVCMFLNESYKPQLGITYLGDLARSLQYNGGSDAWGGAYNIFFIKANVTPLPAERLTENDASDRHPALSPDGSRIAFASDRDGAMDVWVMERDGANPQKLTDGTGNNTQPAWSTDSQRIAFVSDRDGNADIYIVDADGGNLMRLTQSEAMDVEPVWDRRGESVLFNSDRFGGMEIYTQNIGAGSARRLTFSGGDSSNPDAGPAKLPEPASKAKIAKANPTETAKRLAMAGTGVFSIGAAEGDPGTAVSVLVNLSEAVDLGNIALDIVYDRLTLTLAEIEALDVSDSGLYAQNPPEAPSMLGRLRFNWVQAVGFSGDGEILRLAFQIDDNAEPGEYPVSIETLGAYSVDRVDAEAASNAGVVTVLGETGVGDWMLHD